MTKLPAVLRRYCTKRKPCRLEIPGWHISTTAEYVAAFIQLNNLIP